MICAGWVRRRISAGHPAGGHCGTDRSPAASASSRRPKRRRRGGAGQATVELALLLPLVFFFLLVLIEAGLVVRDQVLVTHAAREAARAAAVDESSANADAVALAGTGLDGITVALSGSSGAGSHVTATVRYAEPGRIPLLAALSSRLVRMSRSTTKPRISWKS
jgi:hypothetical protein